MNNLGAIKMKAIFVSFDYFFLILGFADGMKNARRVGSLKQFVVGRSSEATFSSAFEKQEAIIRYLGALDPTGEVGLSLYSCLSYILPRTAWIYLLTLSLYCKIAVVLLFTNSRVSSVIQMMSWNSMKQICNLVY